MTRLGAVLFAGACCCATSPTVAAPERTLAYAILSQGRPCGSENGRCSAGAVDSQFEFNDRGRGPKITAHYELDGAGVPSRVDVAGVNYLHAPVDEHLSATVLGQKDALGSIRAGKRADLLLVEGNPGERISDIRRGRLVLKDGVVFDPAQLYAVAGVQPCP